MKLIRNRAKCLLCNDIIESKHRHDFVSCSCGNIFIDGGLEYSRGGAKDMKSFQGLCEYEDIFVGDSDHEKDDRIL